MTRKDATVSPTGRSYRLDAIGLPEEVVSNGQPVSGGAARLVVVKDGKAILKATPR